MRIRRGSTWPGASGLDSGNSYANFAAGDCRTRCSDFGDLQPRCLRHRIRTGKRAILHELRNSTCRTCPELDALSPFKHHDHLQNGILECPVHVTLAVAHLSDVVKKLGSQRGLSVLTNGHVSRCTHSGAIIPVAVESENKDQSFRRRRS